MLDEWGTTSARLLSSAPKMEKLCNNKHVYGSVASLSHFDKVLVLSKFALLKYENYCCALETHSTDFLGH